MVDQSLQPPLEVTWGRAARVWLAFVWRATVISVIVGGVLGGIGGVVVALMHRGNAGTVGTILGWLGSIPVSLYEQFREFSIRLVRTSRA